MQFHKAKQYKSMLLSVCGLFIFLLLAVGSLDDAKQPTREETEELKKKIEEEYGQTMPKTVESTIDEGTVRKYLIGSWVLDSQVAPNPFVDDEETKKSLKNARIRKDGKIVSYFQKNYRKAGDYVDIVQFTKDRYSTTSIYDYSVKNVPSGKQTRSYDYTLKGNKIIYIYKWGNDNQNESEEVFSIIEINKDNLTFEFSNENVGNGEIFTAYHSRQEMTPNEKLKTDEMVVGYQVHVVEQGQTLYRISVIYGVSIDDLKKWNNLSSNDITTGQKLIIKK